MKRWNSSRGQNVTNKRIDEFLLDIEAVCRRHDMSLSHEDSHGAFIVVPWADSYMKWLYDAHDEVDVKK